MKSRNNNTKQPNTAKKNNFRYHKNNVNDNENKSNTKTASKMWTDNSYVSGIVWG